MNEASELSSPLSLLPGSHAVETVPPLAEPRVQSVRHQPQAPAVSLRALLREQRRASRVEDVVWATLGIAAIALLVLSMVI